MFTRVYFLKLRKRIVPRKMHPYISSLEQKIRITSTVVTTEDIWHQQETIEGIEHSGQIVGRI